MIFALGLTLKLVAAWLLADALSGLVHWYMDRFLSRDGLLPGVAASNDQHHANPQAMLELSVLQNASTSLVAIPLARVLIAFRAPTVLWLAVLFLVVANVVHRYAHAPRHEIPRLVRTFQRIGLFQTAAHHAGHHREAGQLVSPRDSTRRYCVMSNYVNPIVEAAGRIARGESMPAWKLYTARDVLRLQFMCWLSKLRARLFGGSYYTPATVPNPLLGIPRNMICPLCESGKKFKKCHALTLPARVLPAVAAQASGVMREVGL